MIYTMPRSHEAKLLQDQVPRVPITGGARSPRRDNQDKDATDPSSDSKLILHRQNSERPRMAQFKLVVSDPKTGSRRSTR